MYEKDRLGVGDWDYIECSKPSVKITGWNLGEKFKSQRYRC